MIYLYYVKIVPGSTNMRTRAGEKVGGVLTPGPHRDWRHWSRDKTDENNRQNGPLVRYCNYPAPFPR